mmetsp:Transcript_15888/g.45671  ORF Transcript_15888/g.45671 Transcript_15888/m.45671 type:complete len:298 (+) Transcript_15888:1317-2210(+)
MNLAFSSPDEVKHLLRSDSSRSRKSAVIKDTFVLPAGGTVLTRLRGGSGPPGVWLAHCHMNLHREDGMAFVLNVGDYKPPSNSSWLPSDYPECETPFVAAHHHSHPACDCYDNTDALQDRRLKAEEGYKCSRAHLCYHAHGEIAALPHTKYEGGIRTHAPNDLPGWAVTLLAILSVAMAAAGVTYLHRWLSRRNNTNSGSMSRRSSLGATVMQESRSVRYDAEESMYASWKKGAGDLRPSEAADNVASRASEETERREAPLLASDPNEEAGEGGATSAAGTTARAAGTTPPPSMRRC